MLHSRALERNCQALTTTVHTGGTSIAAHARTTTHRRMIDTLMTAGSRPAASSMPVRRFAALVMVSMSLQAVVKRPSCLPIQAKLSQHTA